MPDVVPKVLEAPPASSVPIATTPPPTQPSIAQPPTASRVYSDEALVNILHTLSYQMQLYFQYAIARDQALCTTIQRPFQDLDQIWPPSPDFPPPPTRPPHDEHPPST